MLFQKRTFTCFSILQESADELAPTPPDSPLPSTGAFPPISGGPDLDDEFYAIASSTDSDKKLIYFIGLVDILTYYGVKVNFDIFIVIILVKYEH